MAAYDRVLVEITGGIGTVTLNRPEKLNALDRELCDELREALALLTRSEAVRVIIVTGTGRAFCAGADLDVLGEDGPALVAAGKEVALALRAAPQPVLAVVNGPPTKPQSARCSTISGSCPIGVAASFCRASSGRRGHSS